MAGLARQQQEDKANLALFIRHSQSRYSWLNITKQGMRQQGSAQYNGWERVWRGEEREKLSHLAAMVLLALNMTLSPCTGWNSRGWAGGPWPPVLWLRPIRALIFLSTFITAALCVTSALCGGPLLTGAARCLSVSADSGEERSTCHTGPRYCAGGGTRYPAAATNTGCPQN